MQCRARVVPVPFRGAAPSEFAGGGVPAPIVIAPNKAFDVFPDAGF